MSKPVFENAIIDQGRSALSTRAWMGAKVKDTRANLHANKSFETVFQRI